MNLTKLKAGILILFIFQAFQFNIPVHAVNPPPSTPVWAYYSDCASGNLLARCWAHQQNPVSFSANDFIVIISDYAIEDIAQKFQAIPTDTNSGSCPGVGSTILTWNTVLWNNISFAGPYGHTMYEEIFYTIAPSSQSTDCISVSYQSSVIAASDLYVIDEGQFTGNVNIQTQTSICNSNCGNLMQMPIRYIPLDSFVVATYEGTFTAPIPVPSLSSGYSCSYPTGGCPTYNGAIYGGVGNTGYQDMAVYGTDAQIGTSTTFGLGVTSGTVAPYIGAAAIFGATSQFNYCPTTTPSQNAVNILLNFWPLWLFPLFLGGLFGLIGVFIGFIIGVTLGSVMNILPVWVPVSLIMVLGFTIVKREF